jgi:drug/metabolite transporter (DMT)-like permease
MKDRWKDVGMIAGMVIAWTAYYAVSKFMVDRTGSPYAAGLLLRAAALVFLTVQLAVTGGFKELFRQGKATVILVIIGVFGFLLDLFANLGYANGGSLGTGTALLKTDVLMVNLLTVAIYHKRLYATDWIGSLLMLFGVLLVLGLDFKELSFRPTDLFFIASAACVTANAFIIKAAQDKHRQKADTISYYNNFVVLLLFGLFALVRGDLAALKYLIYAMILIVLVIFNNAPKLAPLKERRVGENLAGKEQPLTAEAGHYRFVRHFSLSLKLPRG